MLIILNLYVLYFSLTSLIGNSFQTPLQIFIGLIAGREVTPDTNTSIPTASSAQLLLQMSGATTTLAVADSQRRG